MSKASKVQSSNLGALVSELGFSDGRAGRDAKTFTKSVADFRVAFTAKGNRLPTSNPDTPEARNFAVEFCSEENRGETFWPPTSSGRLPTWQHDREKILKALAHIFTLQAYYKYQRDRKSQKKDVGVTTPVRSLSGNDRELSPESMLYVAPSPPSGTRRRPAKNLDLDPSSKEGQAHLAHLDACIQEVESLHPKFDSTAIKEFTPEWLRKIGAKWPTSADIRLKTLMHDNDFYDADDSKDKVLKLTKPLCERTLLAEREHTQYNSFKTRVLNRITQIAAELQSAGLIDYDENYVLQKTPVLRDVWKNRHSYWKPTPVNKSAKAPESTKRATREIEYEYVVEMNSEVEEAMVVSTPKKPTTKPAPRVVVVDDKTKDTFTPPTATKRNHLNIAGWGIGEEGPQHKRAKSVPGPGMAKRSNTNSKNSTPISQAAPYNQTFVEPFKNYMAQENVRLANEASSSRISADASSKDLSMDCPSIVQQSTIPKVQLAPAQPALPQTENQRPVQPEVVTPQSAAPKQKSASPRPLTPTSPQKTMTTTRDMVPVTSEDTVPTPTAPIPQQQTSIAETNQQTKSPPPAAVHVPEPQQLQPTLAGSAFNPRPSAQLSNIQPPPRQEIANSPSIQTSQSVQPLPFSPPSKQAAHQPPSSQSQPQPPSQSSSQAENEQILLLLPTSLTGVLDLDTPIFSSTFLSPTTTAQSFFTLYSSLVSCPMTSLPALTFTFMFASSNVCVVRQGDEIAFGKVQKRAKLLFELLRGRKKDVKEWEIVVEIGDLSGV